MFPRGICPAHSSHEWNFYNFTWATNGARCHAPVHTIVLKYNIKFAWSSKSTMQVGGRKQGSYNWWPNGEHLVHNKQQTTRVSVIKEFYY